ncbi:MAG TPA: hypothetical protein VE954_35725 [Oligoflexus sp.]|uniref:hypothetical protein n=1 Tax=Oligoflexus sp. TaxID=1971216 RepID=UPI002D6123C3|nr:hypothetical protein [Oligoflexus sp.]HYX38483.1 hypothetical protein [Oligoflexus sp.]
MTGFWQILISLLLASAVQAAPITDPYVKNLTLVGVIHVEGARSKGQSVAVLRERSTGKTRMLHKGDQLAEGDLEVRELGPQHITLIRGQQSFVLRVENFSDTAHVETSDVELVGDKSSSVVEVPLAPEPTQDSEAKAATPREERRLIPDADCEGEECSTVPE